MTSEEQEHPRVEVALPVRMLCDMMKQYPEAAAWALVGNIVMGVQKIPMEEVKRRSMFSVMWQSSLNSRRYWNSAEKRLFNETAREVTMSVLQADVNRFILRE